MCTIMQQRTFNARPCAINKPFETYRPAFKLAGPWRAASANNQHAIGSRAAGTGEALTQVINDAERTHSQLEGASIVKLVEGSDARRGIYRISVPIPPLPMIPHGFTFNQFLVVDDKPLLWHTSIKATFPAVAAAIETVMPVSDLAYIGYAHCEGDECGAMNMFLEAAPNATPIASNVEVGTFGGDAFIRTPQGLSDGEELKLGDMAVKYLWTPHTPHGWGTGFLYESTTSTLFAGDQFTQHGADNPPVQQAMDPKALQWGTGFLYESTTSTLFAGDQFTQHGADNPPVQQAMDPKALQLKLFDITDYWVWHSKSKQHLERLADLDPEMLLVMHGSSFKGPGCADMIRQLGQLRQSLEPVAA